MKKKILIVDDNLESCELLSEIFSEDYECCYIQDSSSALQKVSSFAPDLVILDYKMPGLMGSSICSKIRSIEKLKYLPVVFVSGTISLDDKIEAFERGADDFISKPFHNKELLVRTKRLLQKESPSETELVAGNLSMDLIRRKVIVDSEDVQLTPKQFGILKLLVEKTNQAVSRETFLSLVWGGAEVTARNVDSQINYLKKKLEKFTGRIISVPGSGYKIDLN